MPSSTEISTKDHQGRNTVDSTCASSVPHEQNVSCPPTRMHVDSDQPLTEQTGTIDLHRINTGRVQKAKNASQAATASASDLKNNNAGNVQTSPSPENPGSVAKLQQCMSTLDLDNNKKKTEGGGRMSENQSGEGDYMLQIVLMLAAKKTGKKVEKK